MRSPVATTVAYVALGSVAILLLAAAKLQHQENAVANVEPYFAVCVVIKNQHDDLREWLEYYKWLGADRLYIYDHNSTPPLLPFLRDVVASGFVEYTMFGGHQKTGANSFMDTAQGYAYNDCLARSRGKVRWLAFFDADEFLVLHDPEYNDIRVLLHQYEQYAGLAVNWVMFGSSGHATRPQPGVLASYTHCLPPQYDVHRHIKVIVNPSLVASMRHDPHRVEYFNRSRDFTVDELGRNITLHQTDSPTHKRLALYHYFTKSEEEWEAKTRRGAGDGTLKIRQVFDSVNTQAVERCTRAVPLAALCCPSLLANGTWDMPDAS